MMDIATFGKYLAHLGQDLFLQPKHAKKTQSINFCHRKRDLCLDIQFELGFKVLSRSTNRQDIYTFVKKRTTPLSF